MKTKNTKQEKIVGQNNLKIKLLVIGITTISMFTFTGCQDQMAGLGTKSFDSAALIKGTPFKPVPAQLASKVTLMKNSLRKSIKIDQKNIESLVNDVNSWLKYQDASLHKLNLNKESWKNTYEGNGVPLLKISF